MSYQARGFGRSFQSNRRSFRRPFRAHSTVDRSQYINHVVQEPSSEEPIAITHAFADFGLEQELLQNVQARGYTEPTPIQDQVIPVFMENKDVVGIANTGTGKTAAFLLPLINKVLKDPNQGVLILAPTRELALQIHEEYKAFSKRLPLGETLCIGGMNIHTQIMQLKKNPHFVIGTPGRIIDLISREVFYPDMFTNIILDEVDRMLDIGFRKDILFLISKLSEHRQGGFFSATMNKETEEIMNKLLTNPVTIRVKNQESPLKIQQDIIKIQPGQNKVDVLHKLLQKEEFEKVIVFGRTKHGINKLEEQLYDRGIKVSSIHGNKNQNARQRSLDAFKKGYVQALLATDIAARGIDIEDVTHVINYDEPQTYEDYVHRIGRTGRAGKAGKALTFVF